MAHGDVLTTYEEIDAALEKAKPLPAQPLALSAEYDSRLDLVILHIDNGQRLVIPREELQSLEDATTAQLADIQVFSGLDIAWPHIDVDHYLPYLMKGEYATDRWKQERVHSRVAA